ncbi:hypothetical protein [Microbacterium sp. P04]|uniref:hypothetical protein n=1 Tax=Microbacterium sp. P04 TaxID=3366947 RepID=UPI0037455DE4
MNLPDYLSVDKEKLRRYATDSFFQSAWSGLSGGDARLIARELSFVLLKPEAVLEGRQDDIEDWLESHNYSVVNKFETQLDDSALRALWTYQWELFTPLRLWAMSRMYNNLTTLVMIVRSNSRVEGEPPCSVRLTEAKGKGTSGAAVKDTLRNFLGQHNLLLNYIHTPDEPADVFRELAILIGPAACEQILDCRPGADAGAAPAVPTAPNRVRGSVSQDAIRAAMSQYKEAFGFEGRETCLFQKGLAEGSGDLELLIAVALTYETDMEVADATATFRRSNLGAWAANLNQRKGDQ